jgi:hypothetical protein
MNNEMVSQEPLDRFTFTAAWGTHQWCHHSFHHTFQIYTRGLLVIHWCREYCIGVQYSIVLYGMSYQDLRDQDLSKTHTNREVDYEYHDYACADSEACAWPITDLLNYLSAQDNK